MIQSQDNRWLFFQDAWLRCGHSPFGSLRAGRKSDLWDVLAVSPIAPLQSGVKKKRYRGFSNTTAVSVAASQADSLSPRFSR